MANAIQTSSKGELDNYHHRSLGSPTTWLMLNASKTSSRSNVYARYEQGPHHKVCWPIHSNSQRPHDQPAFLEARQEVEDMTPVQHMCSATENEMFSLAILRDETENTIYNDLTGRFPIELYTGTIYIYFHMLCLQIKHNTATRIEKQRRHRNGGCVQELLQCIKH